MCNVPGTIGIYIATILKKSLAGYTYHEFNLPRDINDIRNTCCSIFILKLNKGVHSIADKEITLVPSATQLH